MAGSRDALARMVLVDVTWCQWRPDVDRDRYGSILSKLVDPPPEPGPYGPVQVHQCGQDEPGHGDERWTPPEAPYELPPPDECRHPASWLEGSPGKGWALQVLDRYRPDQPQLFRTRVAMGADRFRAMAPCAGTADYTVLIDLRSSGCRPT